MPPRRQTTDRDFPLLPPLNAEPAKQDSRAPTLRNVLARIALVKQHRKLEQTQPPAAPERELGDE